MTGIPTIVRLAILLLSFTPGAVGAAATLSESPTNVVPSGTVVVTWSGIDTPTPLDWIGLYVQGAQDEHSYDQSSWIYDSTCAQLRDPTQAGKASGQCLFVLPGTLAPGIYELHILADDGQAVAPSIGVDVIPISLRDADEMERVIARFARTPNGGLTITAGPSSVIHRDRIIALAARHQLPSIYFERFFIDGGGLISYGPNFVDEFRQAASYVDRILRGEKPADLPVQAPIKYELVINLKTARALGIELPPTLLARADEVIE